MAFRKYCLPMLLILVAGSTASGQVNTQTYPPAVYFQAISVFHEGEYATALRGFQDSARGGVRSTEGLWVDSICYQTMQGECYLKMGDLTKALAQYNAALQLAVFHGDWMLRIEFPETLEPSASEIRSTITWGVTQRASQLARIPDRMSSLQGNFNAADTIQRGGVVANPQLIPINVKEIARCTSLALRRRREIMGPTCPHDPFTSELVAAFGRRPTRPNHWSQSWISCHLGIAYASAGKPQEAVSELNKAILLGGRFDHDLTATALVELGKIALEQENFQQAGSYFMEATYSAAAFDQYDLIGEAFRGAVDTFLMSGQKGVFAPLGPASVWIRRFARGVQAELLLLAAENFAAIGDTAQATAALGQVRGAVGNREMRNGLLGARFNYQSALVSFQRGDAAAGTTEFSGAMAVQKNSSRWLFQIAVADRLVTTGAVSQRIADLLYAEVLREPTAHDWASDPMETLSVVLTPHPAPLQRWFEIAMARKEFEKALDISDRMKRHRFYSTLPMGGRTLALRWILESPETALDQPGVLRRQDLRQKFPAYAQLSDQAAGIRKELDAMPLVPTDPEQARKQVELFDQLAKVSAAQELILAEISLRREPADFVFPPLRSLKSIQAKLQPSELLLAYVTTERAITAFAIGREKLDTWQVEEPAATIKAAGDLLQQIGLNPKRISLDATALADETWKSTAENLMQRLTNNGRTELWAGFDQLTIVPDGFLWYVPFEALMLNDGRKSTPAIAKLKVRYAPTVGLAIPDGRGHSSDTRTAVITGKIFPGQDEQVTADAFDDIRGSLPNSDRFHERLPAPSSYVKAVCDRVIVLADLDEKSMTPYGWSPLALDRGKPGGSLLNWQALPWGKADQVILPIFHTPAEGALARGATGNDPFLASCALMATGTRSVLLSRWVVGGQTTYDLVREYAQELPFSSAAAAWQRSVHLAVSNPLDPTLEPRVNPAGVGMIKARHPFFWAGYMVIDTGGQPANEEAAPAAKE